MSETNDCVCFTKDFSKLIANFEFVHCCYGNRSRKDQTAKMIFCKVLEHISWKEASALIKFIAYFGKIITKKGNKPEIDNLWRHPYVILHLSNSSQHQKVSVYLP